MSKHTQLMSAHVICSHVSCHGRLAWLTLDCSHVAHVSRSTANPQGKQQQKGRVERVPCVDAHVLTSQALVSNVSIDTWLVRLTSNLVCFLAAEVSKSV